MATIHWSNGRQPDVYDTTEEAIDALRERYPEMVTAEEHDRILVWENEEKAGPEGVGDTGLHAVAEVR